MVPDELVQLIEKQPGNVHRTDRHRVIEALQALDIRLDSELAEFFLNYTITLFTSSVSDEALLDIGPPSHEIEDGTRFIHETWGLPLHYICLTSLQGEGGYLYDNNSGAVLDFSLAERDAFLSASQPPRWASFYAFLTWYLS